LAQPGRLPPLRASLACGDPARKILNNGRRTAAGAMSPTTCPAGRSTSDRGQRRTAVILLRIC